MTMSHPVEDCGLYLPWQSIPVAADGHIYFTLVSQHGAPVPFLSIPWVKKALHMLQVVSCVHNCTTPCFNRQLVLGAAQRFHFKAWD